MSPDEMDYYGKRAAIERQRAAESTNPHVIEIHNKLAALYERLVDLGEPAKAHMEDGISPSAA